MKPLVAFGYPNGQMAVAGDERFGEALGGIAVVCPSPMPQLEGNSQGAEAGKGMQRMTVQHSCHRRLATRDETCAGSETNADGAVDVVPVCEPIVTFAEEPKIQTHVNGEHSRLLVVHGCSDLNSHPSTASHAAHPQSKACPAQRPPTSQTVSGDDQHEVQTCEPSEFRSHSFHGPSVDACSRCVQIPPSESDRVGPELLAAS